MEPLAATDNREAEGVVASLARRFAGEALDRDLAPYGIFLLRLTLGVAWITHALLKPYRGMESFTSLLAKNGLPTVLTYPVFTLELIGGTMIILGLYSRQWALFLASFLLVVVWVKWPVGWNYSAPGGGWEYPLFWLMTSLGVALLGDGAWSLRQTRLLPHGNRR
jgi:putative oxidoreductase